MGRPSSLAWSTYLQAEASKENAAQNATAAAAWPFDWPKPALKNFCKEYYGDEEDDGWVAWPFVFPPLALARLQLTKATAAVTPPNQAE